MPLDRTPNPKTNRILFDRKINTLTTLIDHLTENIYFEQRAIWSNSLTTKTVIENRKKALQKVISPEAFLEKRSFDQKAIQPKVFFDEGFY
jgi:hypothetical protein